MQKFLPLILLLTFALVLTGCYSFRGISIPPEVKTFTVENFDNRANAVVPGLAQDFTQALKDKIRNESSLNETTRGQVADMEFSGYISKYEVSSIAPRAGGETSLAQLKIYVKVAADYRDRKFEEKEFDQTFSFQIEYPADQNLLDIQDQLITDIFDQITDLVFNKAFTDW